MEKFLIEVPHEAEALACARAVRILLTTGSHFLTNADFGCSDGVHIKGSSRSLSILDHGDCQSVGG